MTGEVTGKGWRDTTGEVTGKVARDMTGEATGDVTYEVTGDMTGDVYIGLDLGTSSLKGVAVEAGGAIVASARAT